MLSQIISNLNWLHIFLAALAYFLLGAFWYSPMLFAKKWIKLNGIDVNSEDAKKGMAQIMISSFVLMFIATIGIAMMQHFFGFVTLLTGIKAGLFVGFLFSSTAISINYLYTKKPIGLFFIDCGYQTLGCILAGAILGAMH